MTANEKLMTEMAREMNIPEFRWNDARWILRNANVQNSDNPNLKKLLHIAKLVLKGKQND